MKLKKRIKKLIKGTNITLKDVIYYAKDIADGDNPKDYYIWSALDLLKDEVRNNLEFLNIDGVSGSYKTGNKTISAKTIKKFNNILKGLK